MHDHADLPPAGPPPPHPELPSPPRWHRTGDAYFPLAALADAHSCVLRVNSYPDHPAYTLFVDGARCGDLSGGVDKWGHPGTGPHPALSPEAAAALLAPVRGYLAYGSECGRPCDNPFCCG